MQQVSRVHFGKCLVALVFFLSLIFPSLLMAQEESTQEQILKRLLLLEQKQSELESLLKEKDEQIEDLEKQLDKVHSIPPDATTQTPSFSSTSGEDSWRTDSDEDTKSIADSEIEFDYYGGYSPGRGFTVAKTELGELDISAFTYIRYLNQKGLDETFEDHLGRTREIDRRNDFQLQKVMLYLKGWVYDPKFRYLFYTWTANTSQGLGAQVVVAGNLSYEFDESFVLFGGVGGLPSQRSNRGSFPHWLSVDKRTMADEFHRASYTQGIWARGKLADGLKYHAMMGNNLSNLGVDAAQLDGSVSTYSTALWWMPTTGEFGPGEGYGDYEHHTDFATMFGIHYTRSREDAQSQPDADIPENSQIRLSDGLLLFNPGTFGAGIQVDRATYQMTSFDAGFKYKGFSFDTAYFARFVDDIKGRGPIPEEDLFDQGFEVQTSYMVLPQELQLYGFGSKVFGEYGQPWEIGGGFNYFPFEGIKNVRFNTEYIYLRDSPTGNISVPLVVGGNGSVVYSSMVFSF